jgi:hypothetical protein
MDLGDVHRGHLQPEAQEVEGGAEVKDLDFQTEREECREDEEGNHVGWVDDPHPSEPKDFATVGDESHRGQ